MTVLTIDPGTISGATLITNDGRYITDRWNNKPLTKTKRREGEPKYFRLKKLWDHIESTHNFFPDIKCIVCEGAQGFMRGKKAVEASHKFRGIVELYCAIKGLDFIEIEPNDLKQFALGKRSGEKDEMIRKAQELGYDGNDDNEADSFLMAKWYVDTHQ